MTLPSYFNSLNNHLSQNKNYIELLCVCRLYRFQQNRKKKNFQLPVKKQFLNPKPFMAWLQKGSFLEHTDPRCFSTSLIFISYVLCVTISPTLLA